jgi:chaperonin GroES
LISVKAEQFFVKYPFIPSPDGGFYDLGFGSLLGPLNESIDTLINQLIDAGTMANTAGGFISRGIKLRGGNYTFAPLEWKHVDTTGDDLKKGIFPLPVREPNQVLFTLLSLLIDYGQRIGMSVDILSGQNPGQNTPANTTEIMKEQGLVIFNGIYKRTYRSLREEFRNLFRLNRIHLEEEVKFGENKTVLANDYLGPDGDIVPAADPNITSDHARLQQAQAVYTLSRQGAGYNLYEVDRGLLTALKVTNIDVIFPNPQGPNKIDPMPNPKLIEAQAKMTIAQAKSEDIKTKVQLKAADLMARGKEIEAKIDKMKAETIKLMADTDNIDTHNKIEGLKASIEYEKANKQFTIDQAKLLLEIYEAETARKEALIDTNGPSGIAGTTQ